MPKLSHLILALAAFAVFASDSSASARHPDGEGPSSIVGPNDPTNFWCLDETSDGYKFNLQNPVGKVRVGNRVCTGTLINGHNGILTSSECAPRSEGSKAEAVTFTIYGGTTETCEDEESWVEGLAYTTTVVRVDYDHKAMLLRGGNRANGWETTPSDYTMGANLDPDEPVSPVAVTLVGYMGAIKKIDPSCEVTHWFEDGVGRHTCDTLPAVGKSPETAVGAPVFNDLGPDFPYAYLPVVGMHRGRDLLDNGYNDMISIAELARTGFLDGEIDPVWHLARPKENEWSSGNSSSAGGVRGSGSSRRARATSPATHPRPGPRRSIPMTSGATTLGCATRTSTSGCPPSGGRRTATTATSTADTTTAGANHE